MINKLKNKKTGAAMVEFAIMLPVLIVLTIGSIYLSISYAQKSVINGFTFLEARAASVRKDYKDIAKAAKAYYVKQAGKKQKWIENSKSTVTLNDKDIKIVTEMNTLKFDILINSIAAISGNKPDKNKKISTVVVLPYEYVSRNNKTDRPKTHTTVDYETRPLGSEPFEKILNSNDVLKELLKDNLLKPVVDPKSDNGDTDTPQNDQYINDGILSSDPTRNMRKVNGIYDYWGLDYPGNKAKDSQNSFSEKPLQRGILRLNSLDFLKNTGENIKLIETASDITSVALALSEATPVGAAINRALGPIKKIGEVALPPAQNFLTNFANAAEVNNNRMFNNSKATK